MSELTPEQLKKLERLAKYNDDFKIGVLGDLINIEDKIDLIKPPTLEEIVSAMPEMPEPIDHTEMMNEMMAKLDEPLDIKVNLEIV